MPRPTKTANQFTPTNFSDSHDILMKAPIGVFTSTPEGRFLSANPTMARMFGYDSPEDLINSVTNIAAQIYVDRSDRDKFKRVLEEHGEAINDEYRFRRPNGEEFWALINVRALRDQKGKVIAYQGFYQDISDRKAAEDHIRQILDSTNDGIWDYNLVTGEFQYSERFAEMLGYKQGEVDNFGCFCETNIHPEDARSFQNVFRNYVEGSSSSYELEFRLKTKSGDYKWIYTRGRALQHDASGRAQRVVGAHTDITDRKQAEQALRESEGKYRVLFENTSEAMFVTQDGRIVFFNPRTVVLSGYSGNELLSRPFTEFVHPEDREMVMHRHIRRLRGEELPEHYTARILHNDGRILWVEIKGVVIQWNGKPATLNFLSDITERKQAEDALRESETRVRTKLEAILQPEGDISMLELSDILDVQSVQALMNDLTPLTKVSVAIIDIKGNILVATGRQEICVKFHRAHSETLQNCLESDLVLSAGVSPDEFKIYRCKNNMWHMVTPIVVGGNHLGNLFLGQFLFEDEALDEDLFRAQARQYGFGEEAYMNALHKVPRWNRKTVQQTMQFYARFASLISTLSWSNLKLAGNLENYEQSRKARKKLQAQLLQSQKMESVGMLAGGIAHDFNNLLHAMGGNLELLDRKIPEDHPGKKRISTIQKAINRAAQLVRQMLLFSRKAEAQRQDMNLNHQVKEAAEMLERSISKMISIELDLDKDARFINADPIQVEQVLLNLGTNAADAMPDGGRLIIETSNVDVDEALVKEHTGLKKGGYVLLKVSDTGCGMDEETLDKVFDPFFTTKEVGRGTGLGLASVYGIIKAHEGYISCRSRPGKGTTFKIYWPGLNMKLDN